MFRTTKRTKSGGHSRRRRLGLAASVGAALALVSNSIAWGEPLVGTGMQSSEGTLVAVAGTGDANSSGGVAVSGTGNTNSSGCIAAGGFCIVGAAVSGTGSARSAGQSVSALGPAETSEGLVAISGKNEVENLNLCSITFCDDAVNDPTGMWFAAGALIGVGLPNPLDPPCVGVCAQNHYQRDCPEISDGSGPWAIMEEGWSDINGCPIVLRYGVHRSDHDGWGWIHIQYKPRDWDWGSFTRQLTGQALTTGPRVAVDNGYILSCWNYKTSGGTKRTWHVFVDYKGGKGITTVFYRGGHNNCRSS